MCPYDEVLEVLSSCGSAKPHLTGPATLERDLRGSQKNIQNILE